MEMSLHDMIGGPSEADKDVINWASSMFAHLIEALVRKGIFTEQEGLKMVEDARNYSLKKVDEENESRS